MYIDIIKGIFCVKWRDFLFDNFFVFWSFLVYSLLFISLWFICFIRFSYLKWISFSFCFYVYCLKYMVIISCKKIIK